MSQIDIENLINKKGSDKVVEDIMYILMRDLHLGYEEIKRMPLKDILELINHWKKEKQQEKKEMDKMKHGRRH
jgi:hypothetical protein